MDQIIELSRRAGATTQAWRVALTERALRPGAPADRERGEGVISMAIAVLIVAFLGAAAWLAFKGLLDGTKEKAESQIARVGG